MNDICAVVEKITKGTKSGLKAREIIADFFKENDDDTNWNLITTFQEKVRSSRIGRRAKKKIAEIEAEILDYICCCEGDEEHKETLKNIIIECDNISRNEIEKILEKNEDVPLSFIPILQTHKDMLIILYESEIETLNELTSCEQPVLMELFKYNHEALSDIVLFFRPMRIEFKVATA